MQMDLRFSRDVPTLGFIQVELKKMLMEDTNIRFQQNQDKNVIQALHQAVVFQSVKSFMKKLKS